MRAPGGTRFAKAVDVGYGVFVVLLCIAMALAVGFETVPYHVIFVAFAIVYGFRIWSVPTTVVVLLAVSAGTGAVLVWHYEQGLVPLDELSEIVLMPMILVAMVWHARRRAVAQARVEELMAVERARAAREREFLRDASHALRTPLTVARGHLELVREEDPALEDDEDLTIVLGELERLDRLAGRLLVIAGMERPEGLASAPVDVVGLLETVYARWNGSVERHWQLDIEGGGSYRLEGDAVRLEESLDAIVENATKVTDAGDVIRLVCRPDGSGLLLGVADAGPGVPDDEKRMIFQRFWRSAGADERPGSGLGLALVKAVAEAHGGWTFVETAPEGGAFIGMRLPLQQPHGPEPASTPAHQPAAEPERDPVAATS